MTLRHREPAAPSPPLSEWKSRWTPRDAASHPNPLCGGGGWPQGHGQADATAECAEHRAACCSRPGQDLNFRFHRPNPRGHTVRAQRGVTPRSPEPGILLFLTEEGPGEDRGLFQLFQLLPLHRALAVPAAVPPPAGRTQRERAVPPAATRGWSHLETGAGAAEHAGAAGDKTYALSSWDSFFFFLATHFCLQTGPEQKHY